MKWKILLRRIFKYFFLFAILPLSIYFIFYLIFFFLIINRTNVKQDDLSTYQFRELEILFISSSVTSLAVIVALLKDELRWLWRRPKIEIKPKASGFLIEKSIGQLETPSDIRAESYDVVLSIINTGSLHISSCVISLTHLQYTGLDNTTSDVDVASAKNITWLGKASLTIQIHPNGGKGDVTVLQIKRNDAATPNEGQSQPAKLYIGGVEVTKGVAPSPVNKWVATFLVYYDTNKPVEYKIEVNWNGEWHKRLPEMSRHTIIKGLKKR